MAFYQAHPEFETPPDETVIWRYMSFSKFCNFRMGELYFSTVKQLSDPFEGFPPNEVIETFSSERLARRVEVLEQVAVNCWYVSLHESMYDFRNTPPFVRNVAR